MYLWKHNLCYKLFNKWEITLYYIRVNFIFQKLTLTPLLQYSTKCSHIMVLGFLKWLVPVQAKHWKIFIKQIILSPLKQSFIYHLLFFLNLKYNPSIFLKITKKIVIKSFWEIIRVIKYCYSYYQRGRVWLRALIGCVGHL